MPPLPRSSSNPARPGALQRLVSVGEHERFAPPHPPPLGCPQVLWWPAFRPHHLSPCTTNAGSDGKRSALKQTPFSAAPGRMGKPRPPVEDPHTRFDQRDLVSQVRCLPRASEKPQLKSIAICSNAFSFSTPMSLVLRPCPQRTRLSDALYSCANHPGGNPGANPKSISHRWRWHLHGS